ncbi:MAG: hypothetical protein KDE47_18635, partial [Caldilineaceae bacterium]|nr:hypothetical protein [Caldilineaceae bacterium]
MHNKTIITRKMALLVAAILGAAMLAPRAPLAWAAPAWQDATPTPAAAEEATPEAEHTHTETEQAETAAPTLAELAANVAALQTQVADLQAQMGNAPQDGAAVTSQVATAVYLLDSVGLHDLDERLNGEGAIDAGDSGMISRVARLLSAVEWPPELAADAHSLIDVLNELATALGDDNVAEAAPLATQAHEVQHGLSHAAEHWLSEMTMGGQHGADSAPGQAFRVTSAIYLLDTVGLHDLDVRLNEEQDLQPGDAGTVERVAGLLSAVDWPEALASDAMSMTNVLTDLSTALADDDLETAAPLATQAHEVQHDFSHAAEHWLADATGAHDDDMRAGEG